MVAVSGQWVEPKQRLSLLCPLARWMLKIRNMEMSMSRLRCCFLKRFLFALFTVSIFGAIGCSILFVDGPRQAGNNCTTHYLAPGVDSVASLIFVRGLYLNATRDQNYVGGISKEAAVAFSTGFLLATASSAIVGFARVSACREELDLDQEWQNERRQDAARRHLKEQGLTRDGRARPTPIPEPLKDGEPPPE